MTGSSLSNKLNGERLDLSGGGFEGSLLPCRVHVAVGGKNTDKLVLEFCREGPKVLVVPHQEDRKILNKLQCQG